LRGPNLWAYFPVIEAWVDLGKWNDTSSDSVPGFNERLMSWLPGLIEHRCSIGERGGFCERLRRGTYPAHILEHVTLELQSLCGVQSGFGRARSTATDGIYKVVFKYKDEELGSECLEAARDLVMAALENQPYDMAATLKRLRQVAAERLMEAGADAIVQAGRRRNVPFIRLDNRNMVQLGYGARQRRIRSTETDQTSSISTAMVEDADLTMDLLRAAGVPAAPRDGEEAPEGKEYRLLVVGEQVVAAAEKPDVNVTGQMHPDIEARAVDAARAMGLDIAGVDIVVRDPHAELAPQGGAVVEVVAAPDLKIHLEPRAGEPPEVGEAIVEYLFPNGADGRIPLVGITGTNGKTTVTRLIAHILGATGKTVGMTCTDGIYVNGRRILKGDCSGPLSARKVLLNPNIELGVLETARGGILRGGLAYNECQVAVVTNIGAGDHIGISDMNSPEDLARAKQTIVEIVAKEGTAVLNAADPLVAGMAARCSGRVVYFALDPEHPVMVEHRAAGGSTISVRDGRVVLWHAGVERAMLNLADVPMTHQGRVGFQVENLLASAAAAWALGVEDTAIAARCASFAADLEDDPTRFNVFNLRGATVIVDFGHNVDSVKAVCAAIEEYPNARRVTVFGAAGDRRDEDIRQMGASLGNAFDRVILYEDTDLYDRKPGETFKLLREGLAAGTRVSEIEEMQGGLPALEYALEHVQSGELLLAQAHMADPTVEFLRRYLGTVRPGEAE
jgi:cyanophycin synthetase